MTTTATRARSYAATVAVTALLLAGVTGCGDTATSLTRADSTTTGTPTTAPPSTSSPSSAPVDDGGTPDVPVAPASTTTVPAGFPLADGLPGTNGDDGSPVAVTDRPTWTDVELCGEVVWSQEVPTATTDLAGASYTGEAEDSRSRLLAVYPDEVAAQQALDTVRDAYTACPDGEVGGTDQVYEVVEAEQGSATITHRYRTDGRFDTGLEVIELVAIGNALYLSSYYGEGGGSPDTIASAITSAHEDSQPVWRAMRVFADGGSGDDELSDFPLGAGWPTDHEPGTSGTQVPVDTLDPDFASYTCSAPLPEPAAATGVLRGRYGNVEDDRTRELVTFADADAAVAYVALLDAFFSECPYQTEADGVTYPVTRVATEVGGRSFGIVRSTEVDGEPAIGLSTLHVVRLGRAVLLDTTAGEGTAVPDAATAGANALEEMTADSADVVAAMCAFTDAGC